MLNLMNFPFSSVMRTPPKCYIYSQLRFQSFSYIQVEVSLIAADNQEMVWGCKGREATAVSGLSHRKESGFSHWLTLKLSFQIKCRGGPGTMKEATKSGVLSDSQTIF